MDKTWVSIADIQQLLVLIKILQNLVGDAFNSDLGINLS